MAGDRETVSGRVKTERVHDHPGKQSICPDALRCALSLVDHLELPPPPGSSPLGLCASSSTLSDGHIKSIGLHTNMVLIVPCINSAHFPFFSSRSAAEFDDSS